MKKKLLALCLSATMILSLITPAAFAEEPEGECCGACGQVVSECICEITDESTPCEVCGEVECVCPPEEAACEVCGEVECVCEKIEELPEEEVPGAAAPEIPEEPTACEECGEIECVCEGAEATDGSIAESEKIDETITDNNSGVVVKVVAPEGAFPAGTTVSVVSVSDDETIAEITNALVEQDAEYTFGPLAYDITFEYNGEEIQPAEGFQVDVSFDMSFATEGEITNLNVYHMEEIIEDATPEVATFASRMSFFANREVNTSISYVAELVSSNAGSNSIEFSADSFSIYAVIGNYSNDWNYYQITMTVGDSLQVSTSTTGNNYNYSWRIIEGDNDSFALSNTNNRQATIMAVEEGEITLQCTVTQRTWQTVTTVTTETKKVVALPTVGNSVNDDIIFANIDKAYISGDTEYENTYGPYVMKIRFEDTNGNVLKYADGATVGEDYYVFDSDTNIDVNTFAASAPDGYTYAGAFFYWSGHFSDDKVYVTNVDRVNSNTAYGSHLYYSGTHSTSGAGRWTYQASGVLHVVYAPIEDVHTVIFKDHCGYELANYALAHNDRGVKFPSGYVDNVDNMADALIPNHHAAHDPGYAFIGNWVVTGGGSGIDGTYTTATLKSAITKWNITSNITITAQCSEPEITINYVVIGPEGCGSVAPDSETVKVASEEAEGSIATATEPYSFVGWFSDEAGTELISEEEKFVPQKVDGKNVAATYYAKFELAVADLKITKTGWQSIDPNQSFIFDVKNSKGELVNRVTICENGSVVLKDLPVDTYTVEEVENWSWRYTATRYIPGGFRESVKDLEAKATANDSRSVNLTNGDQQILVVNERDQIYWLDGDNYCQNIFDGTVNVWGEAVLNESDYSKKKPDEDE